MSAEDEKGNLKFSSTMSGGDFFKWLLSKGISEKDCSTLSGAYIISSTLNVKMNNSLRLLIL